jgi:hypothetical protein
MQFKRFDFKGMQIEVQGVLRELHLASGILQEIRLVNCSHFRVKSHLYPHGRLACRLIEPQNGGSVLARLERRENDVRRRDFHQSQAVLTLGLQEIDDPHPGEGSTSDLGKSDYSSHWTRTPDRAESAVLHLTDAAIWLVKYVGTRCPLDLGCQLPSTRGTKPLAQGENDRHSVQTMEDQFLNE